MNKYIMRQKQRDSKTTRTWRRILVTGMSALILAIAMPVYAETQKSADMTEQVEVTEETVPTNETDMSEGAAAEEYIYEDVEGGVQITGYSGSETDLVIPSQLDGKDVISISDYAFKGCESIKSIEIPATVNWVGYLSGCTGLEEIRVAEGNTKYKSVDGVLLSRDGKTLYLYPRAKVSDHYATPYGVETISDSAFKSCTGLNEVEIRDDVTALGTYIFSDSSVKKITLGDGLSQIRQYALRNCDQLEELVIGKNVTYLDVDAITSKSLKELTIPASVSRIEMYAVECKVMEKILFEGAPPSMNQRIDQHTIELFPQGFITESSRIDVYYTYRYRKAWENIEIEYAARTYRSWYRLVSAGYAGEVVFHPYVPGPAPTTTITWTFADGVLTISGTGDMNDYPYEQPWAMYYNRIEEVIVEEGVTSVGGCAFRNLPNLEKVSLPSTVTRIAPNAFSDDKKLTVIEIPAAVTEIGEEAFLNCVALKEIDLPAGLQFLGEGAFGYCSMLDRIGLPEENTSFVLENGILYNAKKTKVLATDNRAVGDITLPDTVTAIGAYAYAGRKQVTTIDLSGVTKVGAYAFAGCRLLDQISFPDNISVQDGTFKDCVSLTEINLYITGEFIGKEAFAGCTALKSAEIGNTAQIKESAFEGCESLETLYMNSHMKAVGKNAFKECRALRDVYYLDTIESYRKISIASGNAYLRAATIHCTDGDITHDVREMTALSKEVSYNWGRITLDYDESDLTQDSYTYNHHLATCAGGLATLAYAENPDDTKKILKETLGYSDVVFLDDKMEDGSGSPVYLAHKQVRLEEGLAEIILVDIQGTKKMEWVNDFEIGEHASTHMGFSSGMDYVRSALEAYLEEWIQNDSFNQDATVKVLITGHSRGAAVSNLLGHYLDTEQNIVTPGERTLYLKRSNIFTYTFATPNTNSWGNSDLKIYDNIFNIVNPEDFVTKVVPSAWGFSRYGITYVLPSKTTDKSETSTGYVDYPSYLEKLKNDFSVITNGKEYSPYPTGMTDLSLYVSYLTNRVRTQRAYYKLDLMTNIESEINSGFTMHNLFKNGLGRLMCTMSDISHYQEEIPKTAIYIFGTLAGKYGEVGRMTEVYFAGYGILSNLFANAHMPETYLAAMQNLTETQIKAVRATRYGIVNCPVDITITDSTGRVVGRIINNQVDEVIASEDGAVDMMVEGDSKKFWLPYGEEYTVTLTGNDEGSMDYALCKVDADIGETERICYEEIPVSDGEVLVQKVPAEVELAELALTESDLTVIPVSKLVTGDEQGSLSVDVVTEGCGTAGGLSGLNLGDYVMLTAKPDENNHFLGWYGEDGTLLSQEEVYSFSIHENRQLTAKFSDKKVALEGIAFDQDSYEMAVSELKEIPAVTIPSNASDKKMTYSSSDDTVVQVYDFGYMEALKEGTAVVTAVSADGLYEANCQITVRADSNPDPEHTHIWNDDYTIDTEPSCTESGIKSIHCSVCGEIKEGSETVIEKAPHTWNDGVITTEASGGKSGVRTYTCVDCGAIRTEEVKITVDYVIKLIEGLSDSVTSADEEKVRDAREAYEALSPEEKAEISDEYLKKLIKAEQQVFDAKEDDQASVDEKQKEEANKAVKISKITLSGISTNIAAGKKITLTASVLPGNASNKGLTWKSSNTKVATVNQAGVVTVKKKTGGKSVVITATAKDGSGKSASFKIKVMKGSVKKVTIKGTKKTLKAGKTLKLKTVVKTTKGKPVNKKLRWTSSNTNYATVVNGNVKALKAGKGKRVKITAMATDGSGKKASKTIKIK